MIEAEQEVAEESHLAAEVGDAKNNALLLKLLKKREKKYLHKTITDSSGNKRTYRTGNMDFAFLNKVAGFMAKKKKITFPADFLKKVYITASNNSSND